ncbi:hypothetical protein [Epilithonimonas mollis]|uniref:PKD domain-containing protein n=1 Tax=Epilithonimonas mollis TaxID=216903 RepID=A0A1M6PKU0_9FLAO|nr:hypothetical protein [Epilithonimonas mollis]SHK08541.1 hypothetical protein SAMN05444371_1156 [Epilithonimonas mollis]
MKTHSFLKTFLFLFCLLLVNNCKNDNGVEDETESIVETLKAARYQIITFDAKGAIYNQDYDITIDGKKTKGKSIENDKITISIPYDTKLGANTMVISNLNQTIPIEISDTTLADTPKNIINDYLSLINTYTDNLENNESTSSLKSNILNFKTVFNNASEKDQATAAKFYLANKDLYQYILKENVLKITDDDPNALGNEKLLKLKASMYFLGVCGVALWILPDPIEKSIAAVGVLICLNKCKQYAGGFANLKLVVLNQFMTSNKAEITFTSEQSKILNYSMSRRSVTSQDQSNASSFPNFTNFFSQFSSLKNWHSKINTQLDWMNKNIPFCNFTITDPQTLPPAATPADLAATKAMFDKTRFSVASTDVALDNISFDSEGKIKMNLKLKNPTATVPVTTYVTVDYNDDYNKISNRFDVKVIPKNAFTIEGNWKFTIIENEPADQWNTDTYTCPGQREDQFFSGQATFTANTMKINIAEKYRYYNYGPQCNILEYKEPTGWQTITANHNNTIEANSLKLTGGTGINDENYTWSFSDGVITILDPNTITLTYSFYDGYEMVNMYYKLVRQ